MHILLFYEVGDDYVERRGPFRAEHLGLIQQAHERGELVMAGALADPADGAARRPNLTFPTCRLTIGHRCVSSSHGR